MDGSSLQSEGQWTCGTECELSQWLCLDDGGVLVCVDACNSRKKKAKRRESSGDESEVEEQVVWMEKKSMFICQVNFACT